MDGLLHYKHYKYLISKLRVKQDSVAYFFKIDSVSKCIMLHACWLDPFKTSIYALLSEAVILAKALVMSACTQHEGPFYKLSALCPVRVELRLMAYC